MPKVILNSADTILEFLEDCAAVRASCEYDVSDHRELLVELISSGQVPAPMISIANNLTTALALERGHLLCPDEGRDLAAAMFGSIWELSRELGKRLHVFHGTTAGRLGDIMEYGLVPGSSSPWRNAGSEVELQCQQFTFFAKTWTDATDYAYLAHCRTRGPKTSWTRAPVVLRLPTDGLALERDPLASKPGCLRVPGRVSAVHAEVRLSPFIGISRWMPIGAACRKPPPTKRRA